MRKYAGWAYASLLVAGMVPAPQDNEALRKQLKDTELVGRWIYDDIGAGFAEAKKSGKPLLVVFR